jgi:hypothetical protein
MDTTPMRPVDPAGAAPPVERFAGAAAGGEWTG